MDQLTQERDKPIEREDEEGYESAYSPDTGAPAIIVTTVEHAVRKGRVMQYACVGLYNVKPGTVDEVIHRATVDLALMYRYQRGFVAFGLVKTCGDALIALSVWDRAEQAEAAIHTATIWQQQHVAAMVDGVENRIGVVPFFWEPVAIGR